MLLATVLDPVRKTDDRVEALKRLRNKEEFKRAFTALMKDDLTPMKLVCAAIDLCDMLQDDDVLVVCMWRCRPFEFKEIQEISMQHILKCQVSESFISHVVEFGNPDVFHCLTSDSIPQNIKNVFKSRIVELLTDLEIKDQQHSSAFEALGSILDEGELISCIAFLSTCHTKAWIAEFLLKARRESRAVLIELLCEWISLKNEKIPRDLWDRKNQDEMSRLQVSSLCGLRALRSFLSQDDLIDACLVFILLSVPGWVDSPLTLPWHHQANREIACEILGSLHGCQWMLDKVDSLTVWTAFRKSLSHESWKKDAWQVTSSFCAVLSVASHRQVGGETLTGEILPLILPLVDDINEYTCKAGILVLTHLIDELTITEFRWHSILILQRLDLLVSSSRNASVMELVIPALVQALSKCEAIDYPFSRHLESFSVMLRAMCFTSDADLFRAYADGVQQLITICKLSVLPYCGQLFSCCKIGISWGGKQNIPVRSSALLLLSKTIEICHVRINAYLSQVLAILATHRLVPRLDDRELDLSKQILQLLFKYADEEKLQRDCSRLNPVVHLL